MERATDDERRRVATALRATSRRYAREFWSNHNALHAYDEVRRVLYGRYGAPESLCELFDRLADLIEPATISGETSDGYHTFDELYDHRAKLFSVIVRDHRELAWKSMLHHDGTMYDGMFIVGVETPGGQATYHYDVDPYWELFDCDELDRAPEWDGHTPAQAIDRIAALRPSCDREALLALAEALCDGYPYGLSHGGLEQLARRIREACGEAANGLPTERLGEAPLCAEKRQDRDVASGSAEGGAHEKN